MLESSGDDKPILRTSTDQVSCFVLVDLNWSC